MSAKRNRRMFDKRFKPDAIDLVAKGGRSVGSAASDLGITTSAGVRRNIAVWFRFAQ